METDVRIATGAISRSYLTDPKLTRAKFDKDFDHITEEERNDAWTQTHDSGANDKKGSARSDKSDSVV